MPLDTHVRNLLDMFANSGQPRYGSWPQQKPAIWPLRSHKWSREKSRLERLRTALCRDRKAHYPSVSILLHRQVPSRSPVSYISTAGPGFSATSIHTTACAGCSPTRVVAVSFRWIIDLCRNTSFPPAWKTPMPPPNGLPPMPPVLVSTPPVSSSRETPRVVISQL